MVRRGGEGATTCKMARRGGGLVEGGLSHVCTAYYLGTLVVLYLAVR